ncbi:hypothetical protein TPA0907_55590 [Micromonospora humidisoli]|nr:hypothetical protein TPA0907_55590 [Micromonospora sp. AKA109]
MTGDCDVCGLPDPYRGQGDGIGSCDCPRCDCGAPRSSYLCTCPPDDDPDDSCPCGDPDCGWYDSCADPEPWPADTTPGRPHRDEPPLDRDVVDVHLPAHDIA